VFFGVYVLSVFSVLERLVWGLFLSCLCGMCVVKFVFFCGLFSLVAVVVFFCVDLRELWDLRVWCTWQV